MRAHYSKVFVRESAPKRIIAKASLKHIGFFSLYSVKNLHKPRGFASFYGKKKVQEKKLELFREKSYTILSK